MSSRIGSETPDVSRFHTSHLTEKGSPIPCQLIACVLGETLIVECQRAGEIVPQDTQRGSRCNEILSPHGVERPNASAIAHAYNPFRCSMVENRRVEAPTFGKTIAIPLVPRPPREQRRPIPMRARRELGVVVDFAIEHHRPFVIHERPQAALVRIDNSQPRLHHPHGPLGPYAEPIRPAALERSELMMV